MTNNELTQQTFVALHYDPIEQIYTGLLGVYTTEDLATQACADYLGISTSQFETTKIFDHFHILESPLIKTN